MDQKSNAFLESEKISKLMQKYSIPCIISLLVAALYNIVDQIFIANADYLGSYGNAANTVVFPLTVVALSIAVMIGDGCCAFVSISLGADRPEDAHRSVGNAVVLCILSSIVLTAVYLIFMEPILTLFGGKVNPETYTHAKEYFFWIALGVPFYMFGQAMNPIIRSDGSPKFAMASTVSGAIVNIILDPIFIFPLRMYERSRRCNRVRANFNGCAVCLVFVPYEGDPSEKRKLWTMGQFNEMFFGSWPDQFPVPNFSCNFYGSGSKYVYKIRRNG
jgi:Na+-driven multidrug efflux pump